MGYACVDAMLDQITDYELRQWRAYRMIKTGEYEKRKKRKDTPKLLRATLGHLVKKKDG